MVLNIPLSCISLFWLQAQIEGENIGLVKQGNVAGSAAEDFQRQVVPLLNETDSTFILFSLDTSTGGHKSWVLFTFVPEMTAVRWVEREGACIHDPDRGGRQAGRWERVNHIRALSPCG